MAHQKSRQQTETSAKEHISQAGLFLLCVLLPLYLPAGTEEIGEAKSALFRMIMALFALFYPAAALFDRALYAAEKPKRDTDARLFLSALLVCALSEVLTLVFSYEKQTAFFGTFGWRDGFLLQCACLFLSFVFSRPEALRAAEKPWFAVCCFTGPFAVISIAVLERLGVKSPPFGNGSFLSTIGNINWYCGFLAVWLAAGMAVCLSLPVLSAKTGALLLLFLYMAFISALTQGAMVFYPVLAALFAAAAGYTVIRRTNPARLLYLTAVCGAAAETISIVRHTTGLFWPYEGGDPMEKVIWNHAGAALGLISVFMLLFLRKHTGDKAPVGIERKGSPAESAEAAGKKKNRPDGTVPFIAGGFAPAVCAGLLLLLFVQMFYPFDADFGNGRGVIWEIASGLYRSMPLSKRIFGIGQDCFYAYALSDPHATELMTAHFGYLRLTNAHSELLTLLVNQGIAGVFSYLFFLWISLRTAVKGAFSADAKRRTFALASLFVILALLLVQTMTFRQVTATPYLFVAAGMGIAAAGGECGGG